MVDSIRVAHLLHGCETLGPGRRSILWVAGCSRRCPGCVADPILDPLAGEWMTVESLAERLLAQQDTEGVTFSGGEPFEQAAALVSLCKLLRSNREFSLMAFSGFTRRELEASLDSAHRELLGLLDVLVDGPFVVNRVEDRLWRGSSNQQVHLLTSRHADLASQLDAPGAGVELRIRPNGDYFWAGVPSPDFGNVLRDQLAHRGIVSLETEGIWS